MEPTTIATIVGYLAKTLKDNKAFSDFTKDFATASINWIRPIFLKSDDTPKEVLENLQAKPESEARRKAAEAAIASALEDNPTATNMIQDMYKVIKAKSTQESNNIVNSKNVNTGNITSGGNVTIGDGNN